MGQCSDRFSRVTEPSGGTHDQGYVIDLAPGTDVKKVQKLLQAQTDKFVREQVCEAIVAWCVKRCHRYRDSLDGELIVKAVCDAQDVYQITATYRHRLPEGVLICTGKASIAEFMVANTQLAGREEWVKLLNTLAQTLRQGLDVDFRKSGATIRAKDFGWYEAGGKGWSKPTGGVALPPPPVVDRDEERKAIEAVQRSARALAQKEESDEQHSTNGDD